eukprot:9877010-Alexandrium_andersonii.AAC.3
MWPRASRPIRSRAPAPFANPARFVCGGCGSKPSHTRGAIAARGSAHSSPAFDAHAPRRNASRASIRPTPDRAQSMLSSMPHA